MAECCKTPVHQDLHKTLLTGTAGYVHHYDSCALIVQSVQRTVDCCVSSLHCRSSYTCVLQWTCRSWAPELHCWKLVVSFVGDRQPRQHTLCSQPVTAASTPDIHIPVNTAQHHCPLCCITVLHYSLIQQDNVQRTLSLPNAISDALQNICIKIYLSHDLDLSGTCDYWIPQVSFPISVLL